MAQDSPLEEINEYLDPIASVRMQANRNYSTHPNPDSPETSDRGALSRATSLGYSDREVASKLSEQASFLQKLSLVVLTVGTFAPTIRGHGRARRPIARRPIP